jgi:hypothetical protein
MSHLGEERLMRYVLDDLDADTRLDVERHVQDCERCRERLDSERRLDELLLGSVPAAPHGSAQRALDRLWETVDAQGPAAEHERERDAAPRTVLRRVAPWLPALAAAAALLLMVQLTDEEPAPDEPTGGGTPALGHVDDDPTPPTPPVEPLQALPALLAEPVDAGRLQAVRDEVAASLVLTDAQERADALEALRREGWPLATHLRALALGPDEDLARAALLAAGDDPNTLAATVEHPELGDLVLTLLERDPAPVDRSVALRRALERRAADDDRSLELLGRAPGTSSRRCLDRAVDARLTTLLNGDAPLVAPGLTALSERVPMDLAYAMVMDTARSRPALVGELAPLFERLVDRDREGVVERLRTDLLVGGALPPHAWLETQTLGELVPALLMVLDAPEPDPASLDALVALGGERAVLGLHELWVGSGAGASRPELGALVALLERQGRIPEELMSELSADGMGTLRTFLAALPAADGTDLLHGLLRRQPADETALLRTTELLMELARTGAPDDSVALVEWLSARPTDPSAPLGWTVCAHLDGARAQAAWQALGLDLDRLNRATRSADRRLAKALPPPDSVLAPLGRALRPR